MKYTLKLFLALVALSLGFCSCSEDNLDVTNPNQLGADNFYTNLNNLETGLTSVYEAQASIDVYGFRFLPQVLYTLPKTSDMAFTADGARNAFATNEITATNDVLPVIWRGFYRIVARANDFLDGSERYLTTEAPESEVARIREMQAEAHWLRAHANFHVVRLWGEANPADDPNALAAPLIQEVATTREAMNVPRSTVGEFYDLIVSDLQAAESGLPDSWDGDNLARADALAAKALLGQVYLYQENYEAARTEFEEVIASPLALVPAEEYDALFRGTNEFSSESIFEINFTQGTGRADNAFRGEAGQTFATIISPNGAGFSNQYPHDENIRRFGDDPRLLIAALPPGSEVIGPQGDTIVTERYVEDEGALGWSHRKYVAIDQPLIFNDFGSNIIILRLADVYLMYAETLNALGEDALALEFLNRVRRRAYALMDDEGAGELTGLAGAELRDAIREERFLELFGEGHRWYDIKRWGIIEQELDRYGTTRVGDITYDARDAYLPIPQDEIDRNPVITQSTGY